MFTSDVHKTDMALEMQPEETRRMSERGRHHSPSNETKRPSELIDSTHILRLHPYKGHTLQPYSRVNKVRSKQRGASN